MSRYKGFFWSVFSRLQSKYGKIRTTKLRIWTFFTQVVSSGVIPINPINKGLVMQNLCCKSKALSRSPSYFNRHTLLFFVSNKLNKLDIYMIMSNNFSKNAITTIRISNLILVTQQKPRT